MGNTESNVDSSASRSGSTGPAVHSPSPLGHRRTGSCRKSTERSMSDNLRRSKSCRGKDRHTRRAICTTTGLTLHQKALLTRKWNRMDRATVYELGKMMFESVFHDNHQWLIYIDLKTDEPNWSSHINFKIHVQRFVTALVECMRRLKEPSSACDILRDFGALYANQTKRVSAQYFERLANALNRAAALLQEADHQQIEKTEARLNINADAPDWERSSTSNSTVTTSTLPLTPSSINTVKSATTIGEREKKKFRPLVSRHSETHIELDTRRTSHASSRCCSSNEEPHVCPITSEAWVVLSAFLANQIKLGYELERMLKNEMNKLGLGELTLVAPTSALDIDLAKRPVHANS